MFTHGYAGDPFLCNISPTKIMFWCKKWLEYLDKSMKSCIFTPIKYIHCPKTANTGHALEVGKTRKTDSQHS